MYSKEMVKQSLPLIVFCGVGAIVAGITLSLMTDIFLKIPGLIVVIPAIIAMRGNISTALGSRLGSAYHLGVIDADNIWNDELKQNIIGSFILSFIVSILIGVLAFFSTIIFFDVAIDPILLASILISIVLIAGLISAVILTLITILIIYLVFKRGYDPDNITGPALATFGDMITMSCILFAALIVGVLI